MCWCTSASRRKECKSFLSRIVQLHEMCPALSRMQIIWVFTARYRRKRTSEQLPANGIPMVAIFLKMVLATHSRIPACPVSSGHADAAGCNLALRRLRPSSKDIRGSLRKAGNVMDYKLLQSPRNRPGPSLRLRSRFPFVGAPTWIQLHDVWRKNVTLRTSDWANVSGCISYFTSY